MFKNMRDYTHEEFVNVVMSINEEELLELCDAIGFMINPESKLSKYQAIKFLGISRATFDNYIAKGLIPKGMEQQGFKEKFWYKRDLVKFKQEKDG